MPKKRSHGEGTCYQASNGKWCARSVPDPKTGKRQSFWAATKQDAIQRRDAAEITAIQRGGTPTKDPTLAAYLRQWLAAKTDVRAGTLSDYILNIEGRIIPLLGGLKLSAITPTDVRQMMDTLATKNAAATVNGARAVLRIALNDARRDRVLIGDNPAALARAQKGQKPDIVTWSDDQIRLFLRSTKEDPLWSMFLLAASTGMRRGELCGLRWTDLHLDADPPTLRVAGQLTQIDGEWRHMPPKTATSIRLIPLADALADALRRRRKEQQRHEALASKPWSNPLGLVFTQPDGNPWNGDVVLKHFTKGLGRAGLPKMRFHDLRHSAATLMLEKGADLKAVSSTLGHSTIVLTANTYAHVTAKTVGKTVALLGDLSS